jgi:hypothetical protein
VGGNGFHITGNGWVVIAFLVLDLALLAARVTEVAFHAPMDAAVALALSASITATLGAFALLHRSQP